MLIKNYLLFKFIFRFTQKVYKKVYAFIHYGEKNYNAIWNTVRVLKLIVVNTEYGIYVYIF